MNFNLNEIPEQKGKIAIVTGANEGIGFQTTLGLVRKSVKVIMACRNLEKAEKAKNDILFKVPSAKLEIMHLDLMDLSSVKKFAELFKTRYQKLNILINNAGIMVPPFGKTVDGFESQMGVNYFAHFLLTNLLYDELDKTLNSRVVCLSSIAHKRARVDFDNLNSEKSYNKVNAYSQSKLACLLFAFELQKRCKEVGSNIEVIAVHPGVAHTNLFQFLPKFFQSIFTSMAAFFFNSPQNAAQPSLFAALSPDAKGGKYYGPKGLMEMKGKVGEAISSKLSHDSATAKKLWQVSEELTKEKFEV